MQVSLIFENEFLVFARDDSVEINVQLVDLRPVQVSPNFLIGTRSVLLTFSELPDLTTFDTCHFTYKGKRRMSAVSGQGKKSCWTPEGLPLDEPRPLTIELGSSLHDEVYHISHIMTYPLIALSHVQHDDDIGGFKVWLQGSELVGKIEMVDCVFEV